VKSKQTHLLPGSGIDLERFSAAEYPSEVKTPVFLMIARLLRDKGVEEYVAAARLVKAKSPDTRFQLLGTVDAANRTAIDGATVKSWQDDGSIEYLGTTDDVRPHIAAAHCVVLPSYREGAPRTLIEAAAMARPLIATDVPGCRSVVEDGVSGLLCEVRSGESLAAACFSFLGRSLEEQTAMGRAGREKMETEFDQAFVVQAYRDAIASEILRKEDVLTA
jgi:glycosyltransferase involved in cell wall biosynthesis